MDKTEENKIQVEITERYSIIFGRESYTNILTNLSLTEINLLEKVLSECKCRYQVFEYDKAI